MVIGRLQYFINDHQECYNAQWVTCFGPPCDCNFLGQHISTHYLKRWVFIDIFDNCTVIIRYIIDRNNNNNDNNDGNDNNNNTNTNNDNNDNDNDNDNKRQ